MQNIEQYLAVAASWGRTIKMACLGALVLASSYFVPKMTSDKPAPATAQQQESKQDSLAQGGGTVQTSNGGSLPLMTVGNPVGGLVNTSSDSFVVQSVGRSKGGRAFLNSNADYKTPGNRVIVLEGNASHIQIDQLKGRTVTAQGIAQNYKGTPEIVCSEPSQLQVR